MVTGEEIHVSSHRRIVCRALLFTGLGVALLLAVRAGAVVLHNLNVSAGFENIADALYRNHASGVDDAGRYVWVGASWIASF